MTKGTILPMFMSTTVSNGILNAMTGLKSPQITDLVSVFQTLGVSHANHYTTVADFFLNLRMKGIAQNKLIIRSARSDIFEK